MTNGLSFVLVSPFRKIENASKDKNEEKREAMVVQTKLFDQRAGDAFTDMDCKITYVHNFNELKRTSQLIIMYIHKGRVPYQPVL